MSRAMYDLIFITNISIPVVGVVIMPCHILECGVKKNYQFCDEQQSIAQLVIAAILECLGSDILKVRFIAVMLLFDFK